MTLHASAVVAAVTGVACLSRAVWRHFRLIWYIRSVPSTISAVDASMNRGWLKLGSYVKVEGRVRAAYGVMV
jgi:hypothetical protein